MKLGRTLLVAGGALVAAAAIYGLSTSSFGELVAPGAEVPGLVARDGDGQSHALADLRGKPVVVFFYPKDETPGCTKEACAFRDVWSRYQAANVAVLGVSAGSTEGKAKFAEKHDLPFPLLADESLAWARAFGVRVLFGIPSRVTFLIDKEGKVAKVYRDVDPGLHAEQVLADAQAL